MQKRYSDFDLLRENLETQMPEDRDISTGFPAKHIFRSNTTRVVEERKQGFTEFLQKVLPVHTALCFSRCGRSCCRGACIYL